ncbi:MAG: ABC transporter permease, partial [Candidatus Berkelbacteria bacterium]|nr:ABC transporter permease [Candidatus Berkelbacteria bacterium]
MKIYLLFKQSIKAIFANKGRSFLTILGIVIGIGSVIALMSLGNGLNVYISKEIGNLGTTTLIILPGAGFSQQQNTSSSGNHSGFGNQGGSGNISEGASTLTSEDYNSLLDKEKNPNIDSAVGSINGSGIFGDQRFSVTGATASIFNVSNLSIAKGRLFNDNDVSSGDKVVVLGSDLSSNLFANDNSLDKTLTLGQDSYQVIGVLAKTNENRFNNPNLISYIPYTAAMDTFGIQKFNNI